MRRHITSVSSIACLLTMLTVAVSARGALWEIGKAGGSTNQFALGPKDYDKYHEDGFFVVGDSDAKEAWPYVHPGMGDVWAGNRAHTFTILFGVKQGMAEGTCRLLIDLCDTHYGAPPLLNIRINDQVFSRQLPKGGDGKTIYDQVKLGRPEHVAIEFPVALLHAGVNRIDITNAGGSWMLYDHLALKAPAGVEAAAVDRFVALGPVDVSPATIERDGKKLHQAAVNVAYFDQPAEGVLRLDEKEVARVQIKRGKQTLSVLLPAVEKLTQATLSLAVGDRIAAKEPVTLTPGVDQVIIAFKTHFDIGYTDMAVNIVKKYRTTMIDQALDVVDQNRDLPADRQFVWTIPGWPMHKILEDWPGQTPQRKDRIMQAFKQGRFVVHGLPFTTHTESLEVEDLVRGMGYSSQLSRQAGLELPRDAKMTDVPEHTWVLATMLKHAGIQFMHIGCNGMSAPLGVPPLYWWEGPDGSRVLTMYSASYGTGLMPPKDWPYRTYLALIHTGDNHGPPRPDEVKKVLDQAAKQLPGVKVRIGRLSDFADAILAEKPELPVVRGDAPDTWIHGPMSDPAGAKIARNVRPMISAVESLNTQARAWGINVPDVTPVISAAREQSLLYGEHTWGGSIGWIGNMLSYGEQFTKDRAAGRFARSEASWDEHTGYILKTRELIEPAMQENLKALAGAVKVEGKRIVVYNPLPWKRDGVVVIPGEGFAGNGVKPSDGAEIQPVEKRDGSVRFVAWNVPPMGYRTYLPVTAGSDPPARPNNAAALMNRLFVVLLHPGRGVVQSISDSRGHRELVGAADFGQYLYERFDRDQVDAYCAAYNRAGRRHPDFFKPGQAPANEQPYRAASPELFTSKIERGAVSLAAMMHADASAKVPNPVTTRVTLYEDQPYVDLEITLHDKPADPWPEAGWLCLPFKVDQPRFYLGRIGSIIDPVKDTIPNTNRNIYCLNTGLAIVDPQGRGVGMCALDDPLVSLDTPGCWKFDPNFVPKKANVYVNLFNNQWDTNFRLWNSGTWTSRVRIWAIDKYDGESSLVTPSLEARYPLQAIAADGPAGELPASQSGMEVSRKGVLATAFGANPDGAGTLLRLWEYAGNSGQCQVKLPAGWNVQSVQPVDLRGRPVGQAIRVSQGTFTFNIPAFAPVSMILR